jgi:Cu-Zn family superoxide dismutase
MGNNNASTYNNAIAVFEGQIDGTVKFLKSNNNIQIDINLKGFIPNTEHGFHIHTYGDLTKDCGDKNPHFDPYGNNHGGQQSNIRHVGDLGNIKADLDGLVISKILDKYISLDIGHPNNIIGRSIFIHEGKDDCGLGEGEKTKQSLINGNCGKKIAVAVIGITS